MSKMYNVTWLNIFILEPAECCCGSWSRLLIQRQAYHVMLNIFTLFTQCSFS